ncbi:MAG TPA: S8 family serine peptidase, partial [Anaerolineaceae bacterium]|nr:S8 family serine peptidase [Anaerolineaceae bacterium]
MKSHLFRLFALLALIAMIVAPVSAQTPVPPVTDEVIDGKYSAVEPDEVISRDEPARYIVLFEGDSLVASQNKGNGLEVQSEASQNYLNVLAAERAEILANAEAALNRELNVRFVYDVVLNGVSVDLTPDEAVKLETLPNVRKVMRVTLEQPDTDAGPAWIGAPEIWDGSAVPNGIGADGEGIVAGILDTGINFDHPSFSDTPEDGFVYEWTGDYLGVCHPTTGDPDYVAACNEKLVGAYTFTTETLSPEDANGHGTHTASTVAGNYVTFDFMGVETTISGVAPHAQIIAYDVCDAGGCYSDGSAAAVQQAIINGVDVINYSISGGQSPYSDPVELAFLEAFDAGIFVAASAGNLKTGEPTTDGMVNHL